LDEIRVEKRRRKRQEQIGTAVKRGPFCEVLERAWRFSWVCETLAAAHQRRPLSLR